MEEGREVKVKDLMARRLISIPVEESVAEAARAMAREGVSSVLLKSGGGFTGIMTDQDIISKVVALGINPEDVRASEVMSSPLITIDEEASIEEAAVRMRDNKIRRLVVKNLVGEVVGIVSESDLVRVTPELHFIIRERFRLEARVSDVEPGEIVLAGLCEDCGNYSYGLENIGGRWLCEECRA